MKTLGINAAFHDSAAALVINGEIVAAAEEERFTRIKHAKRPLSLSAWELPFHAIDACLAEARLSLDDIDHVAYSFDPAEFLQGRAGDGGTISLPLHPWEAARGEWEDPWDPLFAAHVMNAPRLLADSVPLHLRRRLGGGPHERRPYRFHFVPHQLCHQASAFLAAPLPAFEQCAVMTLDGRSERSSTTYGVLRLGGYRALGEVHMPHSLGLLYERITTHLGFLNSSDEPKVMALAAMGKPRFAGALGECVQVGEQGQYTVSAMDLVALFGPARESGAALGELQFDIAASLQVVLERTVLQLARWLRQASGERHLAMAGGVALNCVMNARLRDSGIFDAVWVQPAAGDAGTALGAALWTDARQRSGLSGSRPPQAREPGTVPLAVRRAAMDHAYLGPGFEDEEIEALLAWAKLPCCKLQDVAASTAQLLADQALVGWFQGRMEFGPQALGARSILASPLDPAMPARLNDLKGREDFSPLASAVTQEAFSEWFTPAQAAGGSSPFMMFIHDVPEARALRIPAACHIDRTARVQTVHADTHPLFHDLLIAFGRRTGVPLLINTSFNVHDKPIVCTPKDALEVFYSTPLDALVIGSYLVLKRG